MDNEATSHIMKSHGTNPDETELFICPECERTIIIDWNNEKIIELNQGNPMVGHRGGNLVITADISQEDDWRLEPFSKFLE